MKLCSCSSGSLDLVTVRGMGLTGIRWHPYFCVHIVNIAGEAAGSQVACRRRKVFVPRNRLIR